MIDDDFLARYKASVLAHSAPARGSDSWVEWANAAADQLREMAMAEATQDPAGSRFSLLLTDENQRVRVWAAHHLLEFFHGRSPEAESEAISAIRHAAVGDSAEAFGERLWLEEWNKK